jgi:hypothetical protein
VKKALFLAVPIILVGVGLLFVGKQGNGKKPWRSGCTYAVWLEEAEVGPLKPDGSKWHDDDSAPSLLAVIEWRGNKVLRTPESAPSLIARWGMSTIQLRDFLKSKISPEMMKNIALIKAPPEETISVSLYSSGMIINDWAGGITIPCGGLIEGKNLIQPGKRGVTAIKSLTLRVETAEKIEKNHPLTDQENFVSQGVKTMDPPSSPVDAVNPSNLSDQIQKGLHYMGELFKSPAPVGGSK